MPTHLQHQYRQGQHQADPESAGHVFEFFRRPVVQAYLLGLQGHAADWAVPWPLLPNLGVHGTGIHSARRYRLLLFLFPIEVLLRVLVEFGLATRRAEVPGFTAMLAAVFRGMRIHCHAANRILGGVPARFFIGVVIVVMGVMVLSHSVLLFYRRASLQMQ